MIHSRDKIMVSHNSYDGDFFTNKNKEKVSNKVIFVGNLLRFEGTRGIDFLIDVFNDSTSKTIYFRNYWWARKY